MAVANGTRALEPPLSYAGQGKGKTVVRRQSPSPSPVSRTLSPLAKSAIQSPHVPYAMHSDTPSGSGSRAAATAVTELSDLIVHR